MFERFTEEARRATALASQEARQMGHDLIGTEHLLLGLLALGEGTAFIVLTDLEVTLEDARRKVTERVHPYGMGNVDSPTFTPLAKKALERALREALQLDASLIGSEHLLLGLVAVPDGGGARILTELAGNLGQVRAEVLALVGPGPGTHAGPPVEQTKAVVTSRALRRWAGQGRTVLRPGAPGVPGVSPGPPPLCPSCQASLVTEARYRRLEVAPGVESEPDADVLFVTLVYCGSCGTAAGIV
jgi:Clp amino terminal domain, pathogenicity island component